MSRFGIALYGVKTRVCSMKTVFYKVTLQKKFDSMYFKCYHENCFSIVSGEQGMHVKVQNDPIWIIYLEISI